MVLLGELRRRFFGSVSLLGFQMSQQLYLVGILELLLFRSPRPIRALSVPASSLFDEMDVVPSSFFDEMDVVLWTFKNTCIWNWA